MLKRVNLSKVSMGRMYFVPEGQLIVARHEYLFSVGFTARRATSAEVSKASRLTLFLQANRPDLRAEVSKASRLTLFLQANRPDLPAEVSKASYLYSEVFDLKPTSGLYLKNSAHLANFLTPRTVSAIGRIAAEFSAEFYFLLVSGKNVRSAGRQSKTPIRRSRDRTAPGTGAS